MGIQQTPQQQRMLHLALAASTRAQAEAKARTAMLDELRHITDTTRQNFQLKEIA